MKLRVGASTHLRRASTSCSVMRPDGLGIPTSAHDGLLVALLPVLLSVLRDGGEATAAVPRDTEV